MQIKVRYGAKYFDQQYSRRAAESFARNKMADYVFLFIFVTENIQFLCNIPVIWKFYLNSYAEVLKIGDLIDFDVLF